MTLYAHRRRHVVRTFLFPVVLAAALTGAACDDDEATFDRVPGHERVDPEDEAPAAGTASGIDEEEIVALREQVDALREDVRALRETVVALRAASDDAVSPRRRRRPPRAMRRGQGRLRRRDAHCPAGTAIVGITAHTFENRVYGVVLSCARPGASERESAGRAQVFNTVPDAAETHTLECEDGRFAVGMDAAHLDGASTPVSITLRCAAASLGDDGEAALGTSDPTTERLGVPQPGADITEHVCPAHALAVGVEMHLAEAESDLSRVQAVESLDLECETSFGTGTLHVEATPSAQVYVDGKLIATSTPVEGHELGAGNHTVRVYYVSAKKFSETKRVKIIHQKQASVQFELDDSAGDPARHRPSGRIFDRNLQTQPAYDGGRAIGFRLFGVRRGTATWESGLRNGDIIKEIDGEPLKNPATLHDALRTGESTFLVVRRGREKTVKPQDD